MAQTNLKKSIKHAIIERSNTTILISVAIAVFVVIFSAFAVRTLISQSMYQSRVIAEKEKAKKAAESNRETAENLRDSYQTFISGSVNVLGGFPEGEGARDGDNAKLVLDALPSEYDFPALSSSIEKILIEGGYQIQSIGGEEDSSLIKQDNEETNRSRRNVEPIQIPYPISITTSPDSTVNFLKILESSIRPFNVTSIEFSVSDESLDTSINIVTYFQPTVSLNVSSKEVK